MHQTLHSPHAVLPNTSQPIERIAESDHRVANSLAMIASLVRLRAIDARKGAPMSGAEVGDLLDETSLRIDAVAHLHRVLTRALFEEPVDCAQYLRRISEAASQVCDPSARVQIAYDLADGFHIDAARLAALGLLANEAIINAHKYAHPAGVSGHIRVVCRPLAGSGVLIVEDDGVGLPDGFDATKDGGFGFRIMAALSEQIGASLSHQSTALGHKVQVLMPL